MDRNVFGGRVVVVFDRNALELEISHVLRGEVRIMSLRQTL